MWVRHFRTKNDPRLLILYDNSNWILYLFQMLLYDMGLNYFASPNLESGKSPVDSKVHFTYTNRWFFSFLVSLVVQFYRIDRLFCAPFLSKTARRQIRFLNINKKPKLKMFLKPNVKVRCMEWQKLAFFVHCFVSECLANQPTTVYTGTQLLCSTFWAK